MVGDGIKAARIQAQYSPLISSTWPGTAFPAAVLSAVRHATGWLNPNRARRRAVGRHAAPGRPLFSRRTELPRRVPAPERGIRRLTGL